MKATAPAVPSLSHANVPTFEINGDTVYLLGANLAHVSSKSHPGQYHSVTDYRCSCAGFTYRNHCRHVDAMKLARAQHAAAVADAAIANIVAFPGTEYTCSECGRTERTPRLSGAPATWADRNPLHVSEGLICERCLPKMHRVGGRLILKGFVR